MFERVKGVLCNNLSLKPESITMDSLLGEDLGADSLDLFEMMMTLEEALGINLSAEDFSNIETVREIVKILESKVIGEKNEKL